MQNFLVFRVLFKFVEQVKSFTDSIQWVDTSFGIWDVKMVFY